MFKFVKPPLFQLGLICLLLSATPTLAQKTLSQIQKDEKKLEKIAESGPYAFTGLAELYTMTGRLDMAAYAMSLVYPEIHPYQVFNCVILYKQGEADMARKCFDTYDIVCDMKGPMSAIKSDSTKHKLISIENLDKANSVEDDFAPFFYQEELSFLSSRNYPQNTVLDIAYICDRKIEFFRGNTAKQLTINETGQNQHKWQGKPLINGIHSNDNLAVFSKVFCEKGDCKSKVFVKGENAVLLGMPFNSDTYSTAFPSISQDEKMIFFSSNMPGGFGGMDIYVTYLENGQWSLPVNLGEAVNSDYDEVYPFYSSDRLLYVSSDRPEGMGGYDFYYTNFGSSPDFKIYNLGPKINSPKDDLGICFGKEGKIAYISSNREGGKGKFDVYKLLFH